MRWDPVTAVRRTLWIGGGQWCGKTTVAGLLAGRHGLIHYHYDFHDARGHADRRLAARVRRGEPVDAPPPGVDWAGSTPRVLADASIESFPERFEWVLEDLRALVSGSGRSGSWRGCPAWPAGRTRPGARRAGAHR